MLIEQPEHLNKYITIHEKELLQGKSKWGQTRLVVEKTNTGDVLKMRKLSFFEKIQAIFGKGPAAKSIVEQKVRTIDTTERVTTLFQTKTKEQYKTRSDEYQKTMKNLGITDISTQDALDNALLKAAEIGSVDDVKRLIAAGANVNYGIDSTNTEKNPPKFYIGKTQTPLIKAASKKDDQGLEIIQALIEAGANVNAAIKDGNGIKTVLDFAELAENSSQTVKLLQEKEAERGPRL